MLARCLVLAFMLTLTTAVASADETPSRLSTIGAGPNGFVKHSGLTGFPVLDWDAPGWQVEELLDYESSSKIWHSKYMMKSNVPAEYYTAPLGTDLNPVQRQSTSDTGAKIVWPGLRYPLPHLATTPIRETWTFATPERLDRLFEIQQHSSWIESDHASCAKIS